jgi:myotubularin-related protein 9
MPVLVHGAEGTDSSLLVTSLAQVLLDADTRSIRGFQALVETEWTSAGHPFFRRCAHCAYATGATTGPHEAPVFLFFLDCVWQVRGFSEN